MSHSLDHPTLDPLLTALTAAPHWYVGFSGGVDSTALLHLLGAWHRAHQNAPPLTALHVNHGLHLQAGEWENHCAWICRFLEIPFQALRADVVVAGEGPEAAARDARYKLFQEQLGEGDVLFLGHHQDDQVETFFLRLLRGAGVDGLAAMAPERALGRGQVVRPLLDVSRSALESYVSGHGLQCVKDPSNEDVELDRNYLRREIMPRLEQRWPGYRQTVARASEHLAGASQRLRRSVTPLATVHSAAGDPGVAVAELVESSEDDAALALRNWLRELGCRAPDRAPLQELLRQLSQAREGRGAELRCGDYRLSRYRDVLYLLPPEAAVPSEALQLSPGESLEIPGVGEVRLERAQEGFWLSADEDLLVQFRRGGERCHPVSRKRSNSLKKLLQESELPPRWRDRVPLLFLDEELLAVGSLGACRSGRWGGEAHEGEAAWKMVWEPAVAGTGD